MSISNVSFKGVVAVTGKPKKVNKLHKKLIPDAQAKNVIIKDVTNYYNNSPSDGLLARAAQKGDKVEIYITGEDTSKVFEKASGWDTLGGILSNISTFLSLTNVSVEDAYKSIWEK